MYILRIITRQCQRRFVKKENALNMYQVWNQVLEDNMEHFHSKLSMSEEEIMTKLLNILAVINIQEKSI